MATCDHDDEKDIPPLEDMIELLEQIRDIQQSKHETLMQSTIPPVPDESLNVQGSSQEQINQVHTASLKDKSEAETKPETFMGLKKGFLLGGLKNSKDESRQKCTKPKSDIPLIKPKQDGGQTDVIGDITRVTPHLKTEDWLTGNLLDRLDSHPQLKAWLSKPEFHSILKDMEKNPTAAMEALQRNPQLCDLFKDFCNLMGDHFTTIAEKSPQSAGGPLPSHTGGPERLKTREEPGAEMSIRSSTNPAQPTAQDEGRMREILLDPEVVESFRDTRVKTLVLETIHRDPQLAQKTVHSASPEMKRKIQKLVNVGLLEFQS